MVIKINAITLIFLLRIFPKIENITASATPEGMVLSNIGGMCTGKNPITETPMT